MMIADTLHGPEKVPVERIPTYILVKMAPTDPEAKAELDRRLPKPTIAEKIAEVLDSVKSLLPDEYEEKVRHVRDSRYWGAPVGTPLPLLPEAARVRATNIESPPRIADLPAPAQARLEKSIKEWEYDEQAAIDEMIEEFKKPGYDGAPSAMELGAVWYRDEFYGRVKELARKHEMPLDKACAAVAITSAQTMWADTDGNLINIPIAERFIQDWEDGKYIGLTPEEAARKWPTGYMEGKGFGQNVIAMLTDRMTIDEAITGAKRRSFYNNGVAPDESTAITLDVWMGQYFVNHSNRTIEQVQGALSGKPPKYLADEGADMTAMYLILRETVLKAHERLIAEGLVPPDWLPHQTQATLWTAINPISPYNVAITRAKLKEKKK